MDLLSCPQSISHNHYMKVYTAADIIGMALPWGDVSIEMLAWLLSLSLPGCTNMYAIHQKTSGLIILKCLSEGEAEMPACRKP